MPSTNPSGLHLFLDRLLSHSVLDTAEQTAILRLPSHAILAQKNSDFLACCHAYLVADGLVGSFGASRDGQRQITALFIPGDMADLHSVVMPWSDLALQALTPTVILCIRHRDLREVAALHPAIAEAFWRDCVVNAAVLAQWVVNIGSHDATTRMAHLMCEMALRMERANLGTRARFPLPMTQSQMGDAVGLTPVHVNRTLHDLKDREALSVEKAHIVINDWARLTAIGQFDASYLQLNGEARRYGYFGAAAAGQASQH